MNHCYRLREREHIGHSSTLLFINGNHCAFGGIVVMYIFGASLTPTLQAAHAAHPGRMASMVTGHMVIAEKDALPKSPSNLAIGHQEQGCMHT